MNCGDHMQNREKLSLNPMVVFVLIIYPMIVLGLAGYYIFNWGISSVEVVLFVITYYLANISIGVGLHRCWSHGAYKLNKVVEFIFALISAGTLQGPAIAWCSDHYKHHTFTDKDGDPHSPLHYGGGFKGFIWSHMGWMLFSSRRKELDKLTLTKLGKNKILRWQMKYYWHIAYFMNVVFPIAIGLAFIEFSFKGALSGFVFMGVARFLQQQITFCVNSYCHYVGSTPYTVSTAKDSWWLFPFLLGENWHNFHHAFPMDYRNGVKWYHPDIHKWIIYSLEKLGLATSVIRTSDVRIQAKMDETSRVLQLQLKDELSLIARTSNYLAENAAAKLAQAEKQAEVLASEARKHVENLQKRADELAKSIMDTMDSAKQIKSSMVNNYNKKFVELQKLAKAYQINFNMAQAN